MTSPKRPLLSLVTVTWNHREELDEYLEAIADVRARWGERLELVLVDNASSDGTADHVRQQLPWATVIASKTNTGFAEGCNIGLTAARGEYLMLLNPDAIVNHNALAGMVRYLRRRPRVGAVGCTLLHDDGAPQMSAFARINAWGYIRNHSIIYPLFEWMGKRAWQAGALNKKPFECGWLMGACIVVPRAVYKRIGGLEPSYFMYCEDADWCERVRQAGWRIVHHPGLSMKHRQKGSARRAPEFTFRRVYRSELHYANRNLRGLEYWGMLAAMLGDMLLRLPVYTAYSVVRPERRTRLISVLRLIHMILLRNPNRYDEPVP